MSKNKEKIKENKEKNKEDKNREENFKENIKKIKETQETKELYSPYVITNLYTTIVLRPDQMNNKLYIHLKDNLVNKLSKKCYKNFGYIVEIYKIVDYKDPHIEAENSSCGANFDITFSCKLCLPVRGKTI